MTISAAPPTPRADAPDAPAGDGATIPAGPAGAAPETPAAGVPRARCADGYGTLSHLFFSDDEIDIARAKAICAPCGRRAGCLAGAIERGEMYGVWGGKVFVDGIPVEAKRRRGRPPKRPIPVLEVDEVPVPPHLIVA